MSKRSRSFIGRLAITGLLILGLVWMLDFRSVRLPGSDGWWFLVATVLLANVDRFLMAYKWNVLVRAKGISLSFAAALRSYYIGTAWGAVLPTSVGGDVVRAVNVSRQTARGADIVSSVLIERLLGIMATLITAAISAILFVTLLEHDRWRLILGLGVACFAGALAIGLTLHQGWARVLERARPRAHSRFFDKVIDVFKSYQAYRAHKPALLKFTAWSVVEQWVPAFCDYFVARSMGLDVSLLAFLVLVPIIVALTRIPVSVGGFGLNEAFYVLFFAYVGMQRSDAFVLGFSAHLIGILSVLPGFLYFSLRTPFGNGARAPVANARSLDGAAPGNRQGS